MQDEKEPEAGWVFKPGEENEGAPIPANSEGSKRSKGSSEKALVSWSASEYIANPKNMEWFVLLGLATIAVAAIVYFITYEIISVVIIIMLGITVGIFAARQPNTLEYHIDRGGIHIGPKFYPFGAFKSFSVAQEGAFSSISLLPLKRFMPPITIHYAPTDEGKIVDALAASLPFEQHRRDIVDSLSRRLRF